MNNKKILISKNSIYWTSNQTRDYYFTTEKSNKYYKATTRQLKWELAPKLSRFRPLSALTPEPTFYCIKDLWATILNYCEYSVAIKLRLVCQWFRYKVDSLELPRVFINDFTSILMDDLYNTKTPVLEFVKEQKFLVALNIKSKNSSLYGNSNYDDLICIIKATEYANILPLISSVSFPNISSSADNYHAQNLLNILEKKSSELSNLTSVTFHSLSEFHQITRLRLTIKLKLLNLLTSLQLTYTTYTTPCPEWFTKYQARIEKKNAKNG